MFRGLCNVSLFADDVAAAQRWYTRVLGVEPYFVRPEEGPAAYVEYRIGDDQDELGLIDRKYAPHPKGDPGGAVVYWQVDDVEKALAKLLSMGAVEHEKVVKREAGFVTASVVDPFGNVLGLMHSPHFLEMQKR